MLKYFQNALVVFLPNRCLCKLLVLMVEQKAMKNKIPEKMINE